MARLFAQHKIAFFLSLVVGIIAVAPIFLAPFTLGADYQGIQFMPLNDEDLYRGMIHEVLDGHPLVASPFLYEYKDSAMVVPPISDWVYALPALMLGLSGTIVLSKFFLPALLFFFAYIFAYRLFEGDDRKGATLAALAAGLLAVFGYQLVDYTSLLEAFRTGYTNPLVWTRLENPILGGVELFAFLFLLRRIQVAPSRLSIAAAAAVLALSIGYYFSFGMCAAIAALLFVGAVIQKQWALVRNLLYVALTGLVLTSWYWWNVFTSLGGDPGSAARNGMYFTHAPVLNKFLLLATVFVAGSFLYAYVWKRRREHTGEWLFVAALIGGSWLAFNQQILTGREIWYHHFVQYTIPVSLIAIVAALYFAWRPLLPRLTRIALYTLCAVSIAYGLFSLTSVYSGHEGFALDQTYAPLFSWLDANASKDCVVMLKDPEEELERLIPAYTACNTYNTVWTFAGEPAARILHNFFLRLRFSGVTPDTLDSYLHAHERDVRVYFFDNWDELFGHGDDPWLEAKISYLETQYPSFYAKPLKEELTAYRMDYLLTQTPLATTTLDQLPGLTQRTSISGYLLYSY